MAVVLAECSRCNCTGNEWTVQLAQFVPPPSLHSYKKNSSVFHRVKTWKKLNGAWISSRSPAILTISSDSSEIILRVKLHGKIHEEHLISRLKFTWPQLSCRANFGTTGSRVVFGTYYRECSDKGREKSKFALQFYTTDHARSFLSRVQELLQGENFPQDKQEPRSIVIWEESSATERIGVPKPQARSKTIAVPSDEADTQTPEPFSSMDTVHSGYSHEHQPELIRNPNQLDSSSVELRPSFTPSLEEQNEFTNTNQRKATSVEQPISFTSLLEQKFKNPKQKESSSVEPPPRLASFPESCSVKLSPRVKSLPESGSVELPPRFTSWLKGCDILEPIQPDDGLINPAPAGDIKSSGNGCSSSLDLTGQITACLLDPTFQDFISNVEKIWDELQVAALAKDVKNTTGKPMS